MHKEELHQVRITISQKQQKHIFTVKLNSLSKFNNKSDIERVLQTMITIKNTELCDEHGPDKQK